MRRFREVGFTATGKKGPGVSVRCSCKYSYRVGTSARLKHDGADAFGKEGSLYFHEEEEVVTATGNHRPWLEKIVPPNAVAVAGSSGSEQSAWHDCPVCQKQSFVAVLRALAEEGASDAKPEMAEAV